MKLANVSRVLRTGVTMIAQRPALAVALLLLSAAPTIGADSSANWPQSRGPGALGTADHPNLPERWSPTENVVWKVEVLGRGWSSPIVWDQRVFVTAATQQFGQTGQVNLVTFAPQTAFDFTINALV